MSVFPACAYASDVCGAHGSEKRMLDTLGTGGIVSCELWVPELKPRSSAKAASALDS